MSVAKVIEISSESTEGFEDAVRRGIERTARTVENIQGVWVKEMSATVKGGKVSAYRVDMKVTFVLTE
jgi:flavin-binding protein dodecin